MEDKTAVTREYEARQAEIEDLKRRIAEAEARAAEALVAMKAEQSAAAKAAASESEQAEAYAVDLKKNHKARSVNLGASSGNDAKPEMRFGLKGKHRSRAVVVDRDGKVTKVLPGKDKLTAKAKAYKKIAKGRKQYSKFYRYVYVNSQKIAQILILTAAVLVLCFTVGSKLMDMFPYAITVDGEEICIVDGKENAQEVLTNVIKQYQVKDTELKAVDAENRIKIERINNLTMDKEELDSVDGATLSVYEATDKAVDNNLEIKVVSQETEERVYTPEPNYEPDDTKLAGSSEVTVEGVDGTQEYAITYTTVNGKVTNVTGEPGKILDEGSPATIVKGTLGLPEGEDWKTFDGTPVANDGGVISVTAQSYNGKVRYVKGGTSLSSGVDCVGLVIAIYRLYGINLSSNLRAAGRAVSYADAQPGDILCYSRHFGIYIGNGMQVDARSGGGVAIRSVASTGQSLVGVRRVID